MKHTVIPSCVCLVITCARRYGLVSRNELDRVQIKLTAWLMATTAKEKQQAAERLYRQACRVIPRDIASTDTRTAGVVADLTVAMDTLAHEAHTV
ncbi:hypothetical protein [Magnetospira sp. QH-2]|uniref:hypothetical protein n=1 Tax=Magnetospira sp. (strain QH-2) TaxID=1288970 RepID=UPI0005FA6138|nr:hypothetical protein [Magnetospira sp. QH-2]